MTKKLLTTFLLLAVMANLFSVIPPHVDGAGGCSTDCCASARQDSSQLSWSALCCVVNCEQEAETNPAPSSSIVAQQKQNLPPICFVSAAEAVSYILQTQFPSSPTRHLAGCSARYLENNTFLI
ncbi:MAG: hypothetical protein ACREO2_11165 [Arenimonas sp.]